MLSSDDHEQPHFRLDEIVPTRYVSFLVLRNLVACISHYQPVSYSAIVDRPVDVMRKILITEDGQELGRSPRYHHLNALKILGLIVSGRQGYVLTPEGRTIAETYDRYDTAPLSPATLSLFRAAIKSSELVRRNFLVLFTGDLNTDPWTSGAPISLQPIVGDRSYELSSTAWPGRMRLTEKQTLGVIWGIQHWCLQTGLVDEIFVRPQADVEAEHANIVFPVDPDWAGQITVADFDRILQRYLLSERPLYGDTVSISIPLLLYRLCPAERLPRERAKALLREWLQQHTRYAFAEAPSYQVLESGRLQRGTASIVWQKQEDAFLPIQGKLHSRLFVSKQLWEAKGEAGHARR